MNEPTGRFGSWRPVRARRTAFATAWNRFRLADHPLAEQMLQLAQAFPLRLHEPGHPDAGPLRHDLGDVVRVDLLLEELAVALQFSETLLGDRDGLFRAGDLRVLDLCRTLEIAGASGPLGLHPKFVEPLLQPL